MQGADLIATILKKEGTEFLAVYPAQPMVDAAAKAGIRPIICRQERVGTVSYTHLTLPTILLV